MRLWTALALLIATPAWAADTVAGIESGQPFTMPRPTQVCVNLPNTSGTPWLAHWIVMCQPQTAPPAASNLLTCQLVPACYGGGQ